MIDFCPRSSIDRTGISKILRVAGLNPAEGIRMAKEKQKIVDKTPYEFPYIFDSMFDLKSAPEAIRRLKKMEDSVKAIKRDYAQLHRMLREHGYKLTLPHEIQ